MNVTFLRVECIKCYCFAFHLTKVSVNFSLKSVTRETVMQIFSKLVLNRDLKKKEKFYFVIMKQGILKEKILK